MENMKNLCTRNFFLPLLALIMCVGLVCTPAFAADVGEDLDTTVANVEGGDSQLPDEGDGGQLPDEGGDSQLPDEGGDSQLPDEGGDSQLPDEGGDSQLPDEGGDTEDAECTCTPAEDGTHTEGCPLYATPEEDPADDKGEEPVDAEPAKCTCTEKCGEGGNDGCEVCKDSSEACKPTSSGVTWDAETGTLTVTGSGEALNAANLVANGEAVTNLKPTHLVIDGFGQVGNDFQAMTGGLDSLTINNVGSVGMDAFSEGGNDNLKVTISNSSLDRWAFWSFNMSELELTDVDVGDYAFESSGKKAEVTITRGSLGQMVFRSRNLSKLKLIDVNISTPNGKAPSFAETSVDTLTVNGGNLGWKAFQGFTMSEVELTNVDIAGNAFNGASADKVTVTGGSLGYNAFSGITMSDLVLNKVDIAGTYDDSFKSPFSGASAAKVTVNESTLKSYAFTGITVPEVVLNDVTIPDYQFPFYGVGNNQMTVTVNGGNIGAWAFWGNTTSNLVLNNVDLKSVDSDYSPLRNSTSHKVTVNGGSVGHNALSGGTVSELELNNVTIADGQHPLYGASFNKVTVNNSNLGYWALGGIKTSEVELNNSTVGNSVFVWVTNDLKVTVNDSNLSDCALDDGNIVLYVKDGVIVKATSDSLQDLIDKSEGPTKLVIGGVIHSTSDSKSIFIRNGKDITLVAGENGGTIEAGDGFDKSLFVIENGGKLTIDDANLTIKGAANDKLDSKKALVFQVNGGELVLNNGDIIGGGSMYSSAQGAIVLENGAKFTMTGGTIRDTKLNGSYTAPVVVKPNAVFNMSGGKITNNRNYCGGEVPAAGGVLVYNNGYLSGGLHDANGNAFSPWDSADPYAIMNLSGGEISHNETSAQSGGGIVVYGNSKLLMTGGKITDNSGKFGGGVCVWGPVMEMRPSYDAHCIFIMNGGEISGNYAKGSGGGIYILSNYVTLNAGLIANNEAGQNGGGVYVETPRENPTAVKMSNAVIYHNTADVMGGGMYFCPTGTGILTGSEAVFDNEAGGAADDFVSVVSWMLAEKSATITESMLGGGEVEWYLDGRVYDATSGTQGTVDKDAARYDADNAKLLKGGKYTYNIALKAVATENAKAQALMNATLIITGNKAQYGGGVGSNGNATTGNFGPEDPEKHSVKVNKVWKDVPQGEQKSVIIQLVLDGYALDKTLVLDAENDWTAAFEGLYQIAKDTGNIKIKELTTGYSVSYSEVTVSEDGKTLSITVTNSPAPVDPDPTPDPEPDPDPDPDPEVEIPEVDVPLAEPDIEPEPEVEIPDVDVPLSDVPQTGDNSAVWYVLAALSVSGLAVLALVEKRKEQEG